MKIQHKKSSPEIPSASMGDIAFLLIIFFMLTSVFSMDKGIQFKLPKEEAATMTQPEEAIHIHILDDASIMVDNDPMDLSEIREYVKSKVEINRTKPVIVHCELLAPYSRLIDVLDELKQLELEMYPENKDDDPYNDKHIYISIPTQEEVAAWSQYLGA
jgi:biopolymer transport protein ExbD